MTEGTPVKKYGCAVKRYVQTMDLKNEPALIARYRRAHSREEAWKEILDGIRQVGILEMDVYICGARLVMIVEAPEDFSRIGPPSLLIFPEGNLSGIFEEGDEISFVIKKYEEVRPDGFSTGWPPTYRCTVKPCK